MVDEDRTIQVGEKMNMHVLNNMRLFNNQKSLIMFAYINHGHEWTQNTFLVTSYGSRSGIVTHGSGKELRALQSQVDPGVQARPMVGVPGSHQGCQGNGPGSHHWKMWDSHLCGPQRGKIHLSPQGTLIGQSTCSSGGESDSSAHKREKPGGGSGLHLHTRTCSSGGVASPSSDVLGSLGAVTSTSGSSLGIGGSALPSVVGALWSFSATSNISTSSILPLWITEVRHSWSSYNAPQNTTGGIPEWTVHFCRALANATLSSAWST